LLHRRAPSARVAVATPTIITITLFDQAGFAGRSLTLDGDAPDLRWIVSNDLTTSYRFSGGRWEVCLAPNYRGACHLVDADNESMPP